MPRAIMILTPEGKMAQYYYGVEYAPKDLRLRMVEAGQGKIGNVVDQVAAVLLSLRSRSREIQRRRFCGCFGWAEWPPCCFSGTFIFDDSPWNGAGRRKE